MKAYLVKSKAIVPNMGSAYTSYGDSFITLSEDQAVKEYNERRSKHKEFTCVQLHVFLSSEQLLGYRER